VLAVDADPNACLHEALGTSVERSVGEITEEMLANAGSNPSGMSKDAWLEYNMQMYVVEEPEFDLLSMGRPEGSGCYCYANNLIRGCLDGLQRGYEFVVMDNEAGLEHLSRRTTRNVDILLMIADPSVRGIRTAATLNALADSLKWPSAPLSDREPSRRTLDPALIAPPTRRACRFGTVPNDPGGSIDLWGQGVFSCRRLTAAADRSQDRGSCARTAADDEPRSGELMERT
jgi:hypothetical protein